MASNTKMLNELKKWVGTGSINIFGMPFSGKDTQGKILAEMLDAPLIGGGDILRNSVIPDHAKEIMNNGQLIPTEDYMNIILPFLSREDFSDKPLVLSSVGRWYGEELGVLEATKASGHQIVAVVYLKLDERFAWRRWNEKEEALGHKRGKRHDDSAEVLEVRLEEFRVKTIPVINAYENMGLLVEVDATKDINTITEELIYKLLKIKSRNTAS